MFKHNRLLLATLALTLTLSAEKIREDSSSYITKIIKQNGVVKKINVPINKYRSKSSQYGIIVKFTDNESIDIQEFAAKYELEYDTQLSIGYYIFRNRSATSD
ncbi:MAG: hypothetical protein U9N49_03360, partial [Campylobacterota bacterium]|nr:hypothetical protein [Campylobacterota bacterium]